MLYLFHFKKEPELWSVLLGIPDFRMWVLSFCTAITQPWKAFILLRDFLPSLFRVSPVVAQDSENLVVLST